MISNFVNTHILKVIRGVAHTVHILVVQLGNLKVSKLRFNQGYALSLES